MTVWRESGSPVVGLAVSPQRVLMTEGSDTVWLYAPEGKLQKTFVPRDADSFRVFSYDAAISPDGKYGLVASVDLGARLLDLEAEKVVTGLSGGMSRLSAVAYSPDGKQVAIATASGVSVSSAPERSYRSGFKGLGEGAGSVAFSPDSGMLAVGGEDKSVRLFKVADGSELAAWREHEGAVRALAWSPDGKRLASGSRDGEVRVWDVAAGKRLTAIAPGEGAVESLAWSPDGRVLAIAVSPPGKESSVRPSEPERNPPSPTDTPHRVVQLWALKSEQATLQRVVQDVFGAPKIAFAPDGKLIAGFANGRLAAYNVPALPIATPVIAQPPAAPREDATGFRALTGLAGGADVVSFSGDGKWLAAGNAEAQVGVWEVRSGTFVRRMGGHTRGINSLAWSPDGSLLASGGEDRLQVARVADGTVLWSAPGRAVIAGFSPDGKTLFAFLGVYKPGGAQTLHGWDVTDGSKGAPLGSLPYPMRAVIAPDGTLIAADQGTSQAYLDTTVLYVFASAPGEHKPGENKGSHGALRSFSSIHGRVNALRWPSVSRLLVDDGDYRDGHDDYQKPIPGKLGVRVLNPLTGEEAQPLKKFEMPIVALDENGRGELAVAEDRVAVRIFDSKRREIASWPLPDRSVRAKSLAWSPDGEVLAIGIEGAPVRIWRVQRDQMAASP